MPASAPPHFPVFYFIAIEINQAVPLLSNFWVQGEAIWVRGVGPVLLVFYRWYKAARERGGGGPIAQRLRPQP